MFVCLISYEINKKNIRLKKLKILFILFVIIICIIFIIIPINNVYGKLSIKYMNRQTYNNI